MSDMANSPQFMPLIGILVLVAIVAFIFLRGLLFRAIGSLLIFLLSKKNGRIVLGGILLIGGSLLSMASHGPRSYQHMDQGTLSHLFPHVNTPDDGEIYLMDLDHPLIFFVIQEADFSPYVNVSIFQWNSRITSLVFDTSNILSISASDVPGDSGAAVGTGYVVKQFTLPDMAEQNVTFTTSDYQANPNGPLQTTWLIGIGLAVIGALLMLLSLVYKRQRPAAAGPAMLPVYTPYSPPSPGTASQPGKSSAPPDPSR